jgi:hypothetical protein
MSRRYWSYEMGLSPATSDRVDLNVFVSYTLWVLRRITYIASTDAAELNLDIDVVVSFSIAGRDLRVTFPLKFGRHCRYEWMMRARLGRVLKM